MTDSTSLMPLAAAVLLLLLKPILDAAVKGYAKGAAKRAVMAWIWLYTRGLPQDVHVRRMTEVKGDLDAQDKASQAEGYAPEAIAAQIFGRLLRSVPKDLVWRCRQMSPMTWHPLVQLAFAGLVLILLRGVIPNSFRNATMAGGGLLFSGWLAYSTALMLYAWEDEEKHKDSRVPESFEPPRHSFTVLLPARHEEAVIQETIQRMVDLDYPQELVQILVVLEAGDKGTIAKVNEKRAALHAQGISHVRLITYDGWPINKPHGLNVALQEATGDVITNFDPEDEPHPEILQVVNTVMVRKCTPVVQCGVQLINYDDRWFSVLNVLDYFFRSRSRMHYHAAVGMVPLSGNRVFVERRLLQQVGGWDQNCLTEDADLGIRLSATGAPIRVIYDDEYVTRVETPPTVAQFIRQRTRVNRGFLQVLGKGDWLRLPTLPQRLLALYTLSFSLLQAVMVLYLPLSIWMMFNLKVPVLIAIVSLLPLYMVIIQFAISLVGLYEFTSVHRLKPSPLWPWWMLAAFFPYQWLLSYVAARAMWRRSPQWPVPST